MKTCNYYTNMVYVQTCNHCTNKVLEICTSKTIVVDKQELYLFKKVVVQTCTNKIDVQICIHHTNKLVQACTP